MDENDKEDIISKINSSGSEDDNNSNDENDTNIDADLSNDGDQVPDDQNQENPEDIKLENFGLIDKEDKPLFADATLGVNETAGLTIDDIYKNILKENFVSSNNNDIFVNEKDNMDTPVETPVKPKISEPERRVTRKTKPFHFPVKPSETPPPKAINEGEWSKIMSGVRSGDLAGPWTMIALENDKLVSQFTDIKVKNAIPAYYEDMKRSYPNALIQIEDKTGKIVRSNKH